MLNLRDFSYLNLLEPECSHVPSDVAFNIQDRQGNPVGKHDKHFVDNCQQDFFVGGGRLAKFLIHFPLLRAETCRKIKILWRSLFTIKKNYLEHFFLFEGNLILPEQFL